MLKLKLYMFIYNLLNISLISKTYIIRKLFVIIAIISNAKLLIIVNLPSKYSDLYCLQM